VLCSTATHIPLYFRRHIFPVVHAQISGAPSARAAQPHHALGCVHPGELEDCLVMRVHGYVCVAHANPDDTPCACAQVADPEPPAEPCAVRDTCGQPLRNQPLRKKSLHGSPDVRFAKLVDLGD
jgi:hypothetical protein